MAFEADRFLCSKAVHLSSWDSASLVHEGKDVSQALYLNPPAFALIFRISKNRNQ